MENFGNQKAPGEEPFVAGQFTRLSSNKLGVGAWIGVGKGFVRLSEGGGDESSDYEPGHEQGACSNGFVSFCLAQMDHVVHNSRREDTSDYKEHDSNKLNEKVRHRPVPPFLYVFLS